MTILEGLAHVRKRPGMYIGGTGLAGLHHLVWEVVDNSVDEAMADFAALIKITLLPDGGCKVEDDGRGIPTDIHPEFKLSGVEIALTKLGGGGKFEGKGYQVSGGLHGVGVSVVNALSSKLLVDVDRNGKRHHMAFADGGRVVKKLKVVGDAPRGRTGHHRHVLARRVDVREHRVPRPHDPRAHPDDGLPQQGTRDPLPRPREGEQYDNEPVTYKYNGGIVDFVKHVNKAKEPLFAKVGYFEQGEPGHEVEVAFTWNTGYQTDGIHSFANGINTIEGGTHVEGFRAALDPHRQRLRAGEGRAEGEGRQPPGRGHPRGHRRHHLGADA